MQKLKLDKKTFSCLILYAIFIVDLVFILPSQAKNFIDLHSKVRKLKKKIALYKTDISSQDKFIDEKDRIEIDILDLEGKIMAAQDISTVSTYISNKAKENAVEILEIIFSKPKEYKTSTEGKFSYLPIKIKARAGFHSLAQFFNALERGYYFLETEDLSIEEKSPYHALSFVVNALLKE